MFFFPDVLQKGKFFEYLSFKLWFWLLHLPIGSEGRSELRGEEEAKAAAEAEVSPTAWTCLLQEIFESFCREEVLIMAAIKLKMGIKGVVRKETLAAEKPGSDVCDLFPYTPPHPARLCIDV